MYNTEEKENNKKASQVSFKTSTTVFTSSVL